ncbi:hypothetical protein B0H13DRAFT_1929446 [Mycena leptocephala]|nr:hypothetical protein B0H13DRAFT_1929446 [Mycena leptocephala]
MDNFLTDTSGRVVEPAWSKRDDTWFCSFGASSESIPREALKFKTPLLYLLRSTTSDEVLAALDYTKSPVWYNPEEHWLSWIPLGRPDWSDGEDDLLAYLFDVRPIPTEANYASVYGTGSDSDDPMEPKDVFAATNTVWYNTNRWTGASGDVPLKIEEVLFTMVLSSEEQAQRTGEAIKRATLSCAGFIAWFQTLIRLEDTALLQEDRDFVRSLRLSDRPKVRVLYNISRDLHEANFPHLIKHRVPIHVSWMEEEKNNWCFLRLSPEVWGEFSVAKASKAPDEDISLTDLPSGAAWRTEWERSDWFFQNKHAGKRGDVVSVFHLEPLTNTKRIRAYAERFKVAVTTTDRATVCTFFRQNPIRRDEPPFDCVQPQPHVHELESFSLTTDNERLDEDDIFREATEVVREQSKNIYAPWPSRPFNSFNRARELAPLDKSLRGNIGSVQTGRHQRTRKEVPPPGSSSASSYGKAWSTSPLKDRLGPFTSRDSRPTSRLASQPEIPGEGELSMDWARKMAGERRHSSRSASPRRQSVGSHRRRSRSLATERTLDSDQEGGNFAEEYTAASVSEEGGMEEVQPTAIPDVASQGSSDHPLSGPSPIHTWEPGFQTEEQARDAIEAWAPNIVELIPVYGTYPGLTWNKEWLANTILVCDNERTYWHLKTYAPVFKGFTKFEEILEVAIRMALPFAVFIRRSDVHKFSSVNISSLDLKTLGAIYTPGYVDLPLGRVGSLLGRPEAVAFVPLGGVCRFVAEVYDENIVYQYAKGPSLQVTEFDEGEGRKISRPEGSVFYTTDRVSNSEIFLLLGHIAGSDSGGDRTLWPTPEVFECESPHMRGYLSEGSYLILANLRCDIITRKRYKWRTYSQWREYFRVGAKGDHQPKVVPKMKDFEEGADLIKRAFPINWLNLEISEILLPEEYEPHAQRD